MPQEPVNKRAVVFIDGQNLFHAAREAFGYSFPNFDPGRLAEEACRSRGWTLAQTRFYTGVPSAEDDARWSHFWTAKLAQMGRQGVWTYQRPLRYRNMTFTLPGGGEITRLVGQEKGIDVRIALDIVGQGVERNYDVAVVFSQDQDLSEVADELRQLATRQDRWIKIASAFPRSPTSRNRRGVNGTDWLPIDRTLYDGCLDARDYRPKR